MQNRFFFYFAFLRLVSKLPSPHQLYRILKRIYTCDLALNKILLKNYPSLKPTNKFSGFPNRLFKSKVALLTLPLRVTTICTTALAPFNTTPVHLSAFFSSSCFYTPLNLLVLPPKHLLALTTITHTTELHRPSPTLHCTWRTLS